LIANKDVGVIDGQCWSRQDSSQKRLQFKGRELHQVLDGFFFIAIVHAADFLSESNNDVVCTESKNTVKDLWVVSDKASHVNNDFLDQRALTNIIAGTKRKKR
jgi:hypothetical protein